MFTAGGRFIPDKGDNGKWTSSVEMRYKDLSLGLDYRPLTQKLGPIASYRVLNETKNLPAIVVGTGPDQFGSVHSQAYFATASKRLAQPFGVSVSPFIGFGYIAELDEPERLIRGVILRKGDFSVQFFNNGFTNHFVASVDLFERHTVAFVLWGLEQPGVSYTIRF
jgi:hypothetical protein